MRLGEIMSGFPYRAPDNFCGEEEIAYITYDALRAVIGTVFVCISGPDGEDPHAPSIAYRNGCRVFVSRYALDLPEDAQVCITEDTNLALTRMSANFFRHPEKAMTLVAVTGSRGKSSVAYMIAKMLEVSGEKCALIDAKYVVIGGTWYHPPNPLMTGYDLLYYLRKACDAGVTTAVIEIHALALHLRYLYGMLFPICVYTNFSPASLSPMEYTDLTTYRESKAKLFRDYGCTCMICNSDDAYAAEILHGASALMRSVSAHGASSFSASGATRYWDTRGIGMEFVLHFPDDTVQNMIVGRPGEYQVDLAMAASAVCFHLGLPGADIARAMEKLSLSGQMGVLRLHESGTFVIDYAHEGDTLASALSILRTYTPNRLLCLIGSVGGREFDRRKRLGHAVALADLVILTSDNPDYEHPESILSDIRDALPASHPHVMIPDRKEAIRYAAAHAGVNDIVLLAGKGHERDQLVRGKKEPFCEMAQLWEWARARR